MEHTHPMVLSAGTMTGDDVKNSAGDDLGKIEELMIDISSGQVAYAVVSFGGFLGIGDKLFAVPWGMLALDEDDHAFILDVSKEQLEDAPGFDKDNWPLTTDQDWLTTVYEYYDYEPYWS